jgi:hypothetical protein
MRIWRFLIFVVALVGIAITQPPRAQAAVVTYSQSLSGEFTEGPVTTFSFALPRFNPSMGALLDASYQVTTNIFFPILAFDAEGNPAIVDFFNFSAGQTLNGPGLTFKDPFFTSNFDIIFNCVGGSLSEWSDCSSQSGSFTRIPDLGLAPFIGTGSLPLKLGQSEGSDFCTAVTSSGDPAFCIPFASQVGLTVAVTYNFDETRPTVPEPLSGLLLLTGIPLSALARRRPQSALKKYSHPSCSRREIANG